MKLKLEFIFVN